MGETCKLTAQATDILFNSSEAAQTFLNNFDTGANSGLFARPTSGGVLVSGTVWCLGDNSGTKPDAKTAEKTGEMCLRKRLQASGYREQFALQGTCVQEGGTSKVIIPVEHEGYTLDYEHLTIRDSEGHEYAIHEKEMRVFSVLSHEPQSFEEIYDAFNSLPTTKRTVSRDSIYGYVNKLEKVMGDEIIKRTTDQKILLGWGKPTPIGKGL